MSNFTGTVPTILAGDIVTGDDWDAILDELTALNDSWSTWTPTWGSTGTAPAIGDGTLIGRYKQIGSVGWLLIRLTWGSTTTGGTGNWTITDLPFVLNLVSQPLSCMCYDSSAGIPYPAVARPTSPAPDINRIGAHSAAGASGALTATHPFTWATSDVLSLLAGPFVNV